MTTEPERIIGERVMEAMERRARCADGMHEPDHVNGGIECQQVNGFPGKWAVVCKHCLCLFVVRK